MPKNLHGGSKHKKGKNTRQEKPKNTRLVLAEDNQLYALVKKKTGGSTLLVECSDNITRSAIIPGRFYKRVWIDPGDILLCDIDALGARDSCLVNYKYTPTEIAELESTKVISFNRSDIVNTENVNNTDDDDSVGYSSNTDEEERPRVVTFADVDEIDETVDIDDL